MGNLNDTSKKVISELRDELELLLKNESNIEVMWALEKLHNDNRFKKSADIIGKSIG